MTMAGKWHIIASDDVWSICQFICISIHSKADPLGHETGRTMARSAFDAAIEEYNDREGVYSDSGDDE